MFFDDEDTAAVDGGAPTDAPADDGTMTDKDDVKDGGDTTEGTM